MNRQTVAIKLGQIGEKENDFDMTDQMMCVCVFECAEDSHVKQKVMFERWIKVSY